MTLTFEQRAQLGRFLQGNTVYVTQQQGADLLQQGLISVDATRVDPSNPLAFAASLTIDGMNALNNLTIQAPVSSGGFNLRNDIIFVPKEKPKKEKGVDRRNKYPFEQLEVGYSFHVPVTEQDQEPWKKIASIVCAANKRYSEVLEGEFEIKKDGSIKVSKDGIPVAARKQLRKFVCKRVDSSDPEGAGVRVFRVAVE
jgi:hypothetical protein